MQSARALSWERHYITITGNFSTTAGYSGTGESVLASLAHPAPMFLSLRVYPWKAPVFVIFR